MSTSSFLKNKNIGMKPELREKIPKIDLKVNLSIGWDTAKYLSSTSSFRT